MLKLKNTQLAVALLVGWLAAMAIAFWWFQYRPIQSFMPKDRAVFFDSRSTAEKLAMLVTNNRNFSAQAKIPAVVIHFWDPDCSCNQFNESHVNDLIKQYGPARVNFIIAVKSAATGNQQRLLRARQLFNNPAVIDYVLIEPELAPPSSPAVAVLETTGKLAYYGPYSIGAVCTVGNGAFVEKTLDSLLDGFNPTQINTVAIGCFCPWQSNVTLSI